MHDPLKVGSIVIRRPRRYAFCARRMKIFVGEKMFARLWTGQSKEIFLDPGVHAISITMDWFDKQTLSIEIKENQRIYLECGPSNYWWLCVFLPSKSLYLKLVKPPGESSMIEEACNGM